MAVFAVTWDASAFGRLDAADATTNWLAEGISSLSVEPDWYYQGSGCISGLVKTSEVGMYCAPGAVVMNGSPNRVWISKFNQTNKNAIDGNGLLLRLGSGTGAYHQYSIFTALTYPLAGGFQIVVIDPNVSQWRSSTTGTPLLGSVNYFAIRSDCSATAKTQNLGMDAVDIMSTGTGLTGVGGDGASADGTFDDFVTTDEGTSGNRWGIVATRGGVLFVSGVLTIGSSGAATEFTDANRVLVFPHHRVTTGFCGLDFVISNAGTVISIQNSIFNGRGALYTSDDTRPDYEVSGTAGSVNVTGTTFNVFRQITLNNKVTATGCNFLQGLRVDADGATLLNAKVEGCTGAADSSALGWNSNLTPDGRMDGMSYVKGSTATHAIAFGTSSLKTFTLRDISFSGYNASHNQNDSTLLIPDTGSDVTWNISLVGCTGNISYKKVRVGDTVNLIVNPVTLTLSTLVNGTEVRIYRTGTTTEESGVESVTGNQHQYTYTPPTGFNVDIVILHLDYKYKRLQNFSLPSVDTTLPIQQELDPNYANP